MTSSTSHRTSVYLSFLKAPQVPDEAYGTNQRQVSSLLRSTQDGQYPALYADGLCQGSKAAVDEYHDFLEQLSDADPTRAVHMHGKVIAEMGNQNATPSALRKVAGLLQRKGRNGDTVLAHITPQEAALLERLGGAGTRNPETGLMEFFPVDVDAHTREGYDVKSYTRASPGTGGSGANETPTGNNASGYPISKVVDNPTVRPYDGQGSGPFGVSREDSKGNTYPHKGVDFVVEPGDTVKAAASGTVTKIGTVYGDKKEPDEPVYKSVEITTEDGKIIRQFYQVPSVNVGDKVKGGETVVGVAQDVSKRFPGKTDENGNPGKPMTNHIHVEVRDKNVIIDSSKNDSRRYGVIKPKFGN